MSCLIGLGSEVKRKTHLRYVGPCVVEGIPSKLGAELRLAADVKPSVVALSGKDSGEELGLALAPNKVARVSLGLLTTRYHVLLQVNPALFAQATVQAPTVLEPNEEHELCLVVQARGAVDLSALDWLVRLYLID